MPRINDEALRALIAQSQALGPRHSSQEALRMQQQAVNQYGAYLGSIGTWAMPFLGQALGPYAQQHSTSTIAPPGLTPSGLAAYLAQPARPRSLPDPYPSPVYSSMLPRDPTLLERGVSFLKHLMALLPSIKVVGR